MRDRPAAEYQTVANWLQITHPSVQRIGRAGKLPAKWPATFSQGRMGPGRILLEFHESKVRFRNIR
jgi:hypothetical protein